MEIKLSEGDAGGVVFAVKDKIQFEVTRSNLRVSEPSTKSVVSDPYCWWGGYSSGHSFYYTLPNKWTRIMIIVDSEVEIVFGNEEKVIGEISSFKLPEISKVSPHPHLHTQTHTYIFMRIYTQDSTQALIHLPFINTQFQKCLYAG